MLQRVEDRGCAYLPQVNAFYMHELQMMYAAEEAARFLHHACRGLPARVAARDEAADEPADFFYGRVLENALAYFGSRVLYPRAQPCGKATCAISVTRRARMWNAKPVCRLRKPFAR